MPAASAPGKSSRAESSPTIKTSAPAAIHLLDRVARRQRRNRRAVRRPPHRARARSGPARRTAAPRHAPAHIRAGPPDRTRPPPTPAGVAPPATTCTAARRRRPSSRAAASTSPDGSDDDHVSRDRLANAFSALEQRHCRRFRGTASALSDATRRPSPAAAMIAVTCMGLKDWIAACGQTVRLYRTRWPPLRWSTSAGSSTGAGSTSRRSFGEFARLFARHTVVDIGGCTVRVTVRGRPSAGPSVMTNLLPAMLTGTTGSAASIASRKMPPLNRPTVPSDAARALGKNDERARAATRLAIRFRMPAPGFLPIDEQVTGPPQVPAEKRNPPERLLRHDPQLQRQRREHDRDVVDALVIRREHVAARGDRGARGR